MIISLRSDCLFDQGSIRHVAGGVMNDTKKGNFRRCFCAGALSTLLMFFVLSSVSVAADRTSGTVVDKSPNVTVYVGVRDDAKPFSYIDITRNSESIIPGYSGYSVEVCRHVLKQMKTLPKYENFEFKAGNIMAGERFKELGSDGKLLMLCGPDSITQERLDDYWASNPFFLSGMTYAYLDPESPKFPTGSYCDNIIGVVRGTTADTNGLTDIAERGLLIRFNEAIRLEINKTSERIATSRIILRKLINETIQDEWSKLYTTDLKGDPDNYFDTSFEQSFLDFTLIAQEDSGDLVRAVDELADKGNRLANKVRSLMSKQHGLLNKQIARTIKTDECPLGFTSLPVRKYESHDNGIAEFCKGEVLFYLADYDILSNKTEEFSDCDFVMARFTRSREVYSAFFSKDPMFTAYNDKNAMVEIDAAGFYADFNNILTKSMQGKSSDIEEIFIKEFGGQQMSEELASFFDGLKLE